MQSGEHMDWNETRSAYLYQLGNSKVLLERASALCNKVPTEVPEKARLTLQKLLPVVCEQHEKLIANRFEVAVLGTEKAGKSSLLNAWLGEDILPNKDERCTYTSCEIWSASEEEQKYHIEYYTPQEFEQQIAGKREEAKNFPEGGSDRSKIEDDIKEIEELREQINHFLCKGHDEKSFNDVNEIREDLKLAIAENKAQARAVKRLQLRTIKLREDRDIVFHDVPGFDSPLQMHKAQAEEKVRQCDVIIYAKPHDKPDLTDSEVRMLKMADEADKHVKVAQKIFIALSKIDHSKTSEQFQERIKTAHAKWGDVPEERIVPVCPPARLYDLGTGSQEIMKIGPRILQDLESISATDGIKDLKREVNLYIDSDRAHILKKRCQGLVDDVIKVISDILQTLQQRYPDNKEELFDAIEDERLENLTDWWSEQWKKIEEEFTEYYISQIMPKQDVDALPQENEKLRQFHVTFNELMDKLQAGLELDEEEFEKRYKTLGLSEEGIILGEQSHYKLRGELYIKGMDGLHELSSELANSLEVIIMEMIDWIVKRLWGIERINKYLYNHSEQLHKRIEHGMSTLFLRFARPVLGLFLRTPRSCSSRDRLIETYQSEIVVLGEFYQGKNSQSKKYLKTFLTIGKWAASFAETTNRVPKGSRKLVDEVESKVRKPHMDKNLSYFDDIAPVVRLKPADNIEDIKKEICGDLKALNDYLKNSVFFAAGFLSYCHQELDRVKRHFLENEREWYKAVASSFRRKHSPLMAAIPFNSEQDFEFKRGIIVELEDVQNLLKKVQKS